MHSYELEHQEQCIGKEINETILEILVHDLSYEKINCYVYSKKDPTKILKTSIDYLIAVLERAKYRVEKYQQYGKSPLHVCLYVIEKIDGFITYLQTEFSTKTDAIPLAR